nr:NADH dehydrogenase subunit 6 [Dendrobaena tellermanica]
MTLTIYLLLMTATSMTLLLSSTPIILGMNILMMALLLSASLAAFLSSWFAFLIFLIYIGGMLVLFAYFLALTPNQQMTSSNSLLYMIITLITLLMVSYLSNMKIPTMAQFIQGNSLLYIPMTSTFLIILAAVLLMTMIIVVKLTMRSKGPLRPFN